MYRVVEDITAFFRKEKRYTWLLCIAVSVYALCSFFMPSDGAIPSPAQEEFRKVDVLHNSAEEAELLMASLRADPNMAIWVIVFHVFFLTAIIGGLVAHISVFIRMRRKEELVQKGVPDSTVAWHMSDVTKVLIIMFAVSLGAGFLPHVLKFVFSMTLSENTFILLHASFLDCITVLLIVYFAYKQYGPLRAMKTSICWYDMWIGVCAYMWVLPVFLIMVGVLGVLAQWFHYEPPAHTLIDILVLEDGRHPVLVWYSVILACVLGPVVEELFFRGFVYGAVKKRWGMRVAMIASACFFAYVHQSFFAIVPIFFLGIVLAYVREKRGGLVSSIVMHSMHNSVLLAYFFFIKRMVIDQL